MTNATKTLTEYMETTHSGDYLPFVESHPVTEINVAEPDIDKTAAAAQRLARALRKDGWDACAKRRFVYVRFSH